MTQQPDNIDKHLQNQLDQPLNVLTVADLEALIVKIVQKVLTEERTRIGQEDFQSKSVKIDFPPQALLETFGSWQEERTAEEIIDEIYASRTIPTGEYSL